MADLSSVPPRELSRGYSYRLFDLGISSDLPLLQAEQALPGHDVTIRRVSLALEPPREGEGGPLVSSGPGFARFFWPHIGWMEVRNGREILVDPAPDAGPELLSHIIEGIGMGMLLDQRGVFTLHASAVAIDGHAVAFLGWKGQGKSTLCAALYGRSHGFVTDDVLALAGVGEGPVQVLPGTAQVKLFPDSLEASLGESSEAFPRIWELSPKRVRVIRDGVDDVLPLAALYILDSHAADADVVIEPLPAQAACLELVRHSYALRFLEQRGATPQHLALCAWLARNVPVRRLTRPRDVSRILESAEALERDARTLVAGAASDRHPSPSPVAS
ncbi:MAG TPA: hypothetical protein VFL93_02450 [Longimicrobiaceae bacterium]|nr:hypothetical protein [Longimicrobiaceae bacterium]